jgi:L-lactate dehydrogenase complex protein LldG
LADVDHAVVRACCGVAETGSVLLTDVDLKVYARANLAQGNRVKRSVTKG